MADARQVFQRLVSLKIIDADIQQVASAALPPGADIARLARTLLNLGVITPFQADAIGRGRPEELVYGDNGRFVCRELLGQGGMGCVYKAWQGSVKRWVALKTISGKALRADMLKQMKQRFQRELEATGRLEHPNIIRIYDGGVRDDESYLAMEYVEGTTLHDAVVRDGPRPWAQVCEWIAQAAEGLGYAHEKKIVHRDVKPDNLMLTNRGTIKVLDLGLARFLDGDDSLTHTAVAMGTVDYMAPEQSEDAKRADERSDIYSLGCTLYFLCAGKAVFAHRNGVIPKIAAHASEAPPQLRDACPDAPERLEAIYQKMLRKRSEDRHQSMSDVADELRALIVKTVPKSDSTLSPSPSQPPARSALPSSSTPHWVGATLALLAAAVVILGLLLAIAIRRYNERPSPDAIVKSTENTGKVGSDSSAAVDKKTHAELGDEPKAEPPRIALYEGSKAGEQWSGNGLSMALIWCPAGEFRMGSPETELGREDDENLVQARLTRGFWMGKHEVTQDEWRRAMGTTIHDQARKGGLNQTLNGEGPKRPMYFVNHEDAVEFCRRLTDLERKAGRLPADWEYALPTEAQWEYACRAGANTATAFGDRLSSYQANIDCNLPYNTEEKGPCLGMAAEVGSYPANAWGLHDMHGNVWEWCRDGYGKALKSGDDPEGPTPASPTSDRVIRGGGWPSNGVTCRSANRHAGFPVNRNHYDGFRVSAVRRN